MPGIYVLSNEAFGSVQLKERIDQLEKIAKSAIFCVGLPDDCLLYTSDAADEE